MKKRLLCCYFLCTTFFLIGQHQEKKKFEFGLVFSAKYDYLKTELSDWNALGINNSVNNLTTTNRVGFSLGLLYKFNLSDYLAIVPQTILSFQESNFTYDLTNATRHQEAIIPAALSVPLHFVFTKPINEKFNPSILLGIRYILDITNYDVENPFQNTPFIDYKFRPKKQSTALDFGVGLEISTKKFKLKPELLYSLGLENLAVDNSNFYNTAVGSLHQDKIALRILFYR